MLLQICCFFKLFAIKNVKNKDFNLRLECTATKCWSKYTTNTTSFLTNIGTLKWHYLQWLAIICAKIRILLYICRKTEWYSIIVATTEKMKMDVGLHKYFDVSPKMIPMSLSIFVCVCLFFCSSYLFDFVSVCCLSFYLCLLIFLRMKQVRMKQFVNYV